MVAAVSTGSSSGGSYSGSRGRLRMACITLTMVMFRAPSNPMTKITRNSTTAPTVLNRLENSIASVPEIRPPAVPLIPPRQRMPTTAPVHSGLTPPNSCPKAPVAMGSRNAQTMRNFTGRPRWNIRIQKLSSRITGSRYRPLPMRPRVTSRSSLIKSAFTPKQPSSRKKPRNRQTTAPTSRWMGFFPAERCVELRRVVDCLVDLPPVVERGFFFVSAMILPLSPGYQGTIRDRISVTRPAPQQ